MTELSRPSSVEVEDIIHQLVQNILSRFFVDDASGSFMEQSVEGNIDNHPDNGDEFSDTVGTSRDYLAKLLFWLVTVITLQKLVLHIFKLIICMTLLANFILNWCPIVFYVLQVYVVRSSLKRIRKQIAT